MAFTQAESNFVSSSAQTAKALLNLEGQLDQLNVLWAGSPGYNTSITQGDLDSVASFSGLTTTQLGDAEFAMATILTTIKNALPALTVVANLP